MQPAGKGADNGAHHADPPFADHDPPIVDEDQDTWDTDSALGGVRSYAYDHLRPSSLFMTSHGRPNGKF